MNVLEYRTLQKTGCVHYKHKRALNPLCSDTDPTQDVPVKNIQLLANGDPLNVIKRNLQFGANIDNLTAIERRNCDSFDALTEQKQLERKVATDINKYNLLKNLNKNED